MCNTIPHVEKTDGRFNKKELQKANQIEFRIEKLIKKKCYKSNYILRGKFMVIHLITG